MTHVVVIQKGHKIRKPDIVDAFDQMKAGMKPEIDGYDPEVISRIVVKVIAAFEKESAPSGSCPIKWVCEYVNTRGGDVVMI